MNAKITITVPIEELNKTVFEMVERVAAKTESLSIDLTAISKQVLNSDDLLKQMESLDNARKLLTLLDANLEDCYSILSGLVRYKTEQTLGQKDAKQPAE